MSRPLYWNNARITKTKRIFKKCESIDAGISLLKKEFNNTDITEDSLRSAWYRYVGSSDLSLLLNKKKRNKVSKKTVRSTPRLSDTKLAVISDLHCGSKLGLTPPGWQRTKAQAELWGWYVATAKSIGPIKALILNGDSLDGSGKKSGGTEQITTDRLEQVEMAQECLEVWRAEKIYLTFGTGYHTGSEEDFESVLAKSVGGVVEDKLFRTINGVSFDIRHHIGSSSVPYSRGTAVAKEKSWAMLHQAMGEQDHVDYLLRGHVHYHVAVTDPDGTAMTLPCLQYPGTKFGARRCTGRVHMGLMEFIVNSKTDHRYKFHPYMTQSIKTKTKRF